MPVNPMPNFAFLSDLFWSLTMIMSIIRLIRINCCLNCQPTYKYSTYVPTNFPFQTNYFR